MNAAVPWDAIDHEWHERRFDLLHDTVERFGGLDVERLDELFTPGSQAEPEPVLADSFGAVDGSTEARGLLATYVYGKCLERWEKSEDHGPIEKVLEALRGVLGRNGHDDPVLALVVEQTHCMEHAMGVENALMCSCPVAMEQQAAAVVEGTGRVLNGRRRPAGNTQLVALLRGDAATQRIYYSAVRDTAAAVLAMLEAEAPGPAKLGKAIRELRAAERHQSVRGDVYESELRAHRVGLAALEDAATLPRVWVDDADVVYLYPFAFEDQTEESLDALLARLDESWSPELGPKRIRPLSVERPLLTNVWEQPGAAEPMYRVVEIRLPDVTVIPTAGEMWKFDCQVALRLSRIGNHCLRVGSQLEDTDVHDLNQALRRGSRSMGNEELISGELRWDKFVDYAGEMIAGLAGALGVATVGEPSADFHVALDAHRLSIQRGRRRRRLPFERPRKSSRPATAAELEGAVGASLLFHPVRHLASSLEEWVRYPPPEVRNLMQGAGYTDDLVVRTANTTVLYMPSSPDWSCSAYAELVEFVASVPPLLASWEAEVLEREERLRLDLEGASPLTLEQVLDREKQLRALESNVRHELAKLHSRRLVRDRVHREFLDRLWMAAGLESLEDEIERELAVMATLLERLSTRAATIAEETRRKTRRKVEIILGVIAVISVTGFFSWVNDNFGLDARWVAGGESALLLVLIVAVVVLVSREDAT
ncbi:MAG TPA: hypothetical protein VF517_00255 [Thermoleophilaceae bacterium]